jgi:ABC-type antimicrobial peptide transport system permease subunit
MVVRDGLEVLVPGVVLGTACALAAARLVQSQLYGLRSNNPGTYAAAAALFLGAGIVAVSLPARRAVRIDPAASLRQE